MNYPEIKVGTVLRYSNQLKYTFTVIERIGDRINMPQGYGNSYYHLNPTFMSTWSVVGQSLSINDIALNETYTDGTEKYRVVYKNGKCVLAYTQDRVQEMPVLYTQDDISSWKVYVKPSKPVVATVTFFRNKRSGTVGCILGDTSKQHGFAEHCEVLRVDTIEYKE